MLLSTCPGDLPQTISDGSAGVALTITSPAKF